MMHSQRTFIQFVSATACSCVNSWKEAFNPYNYSIFCHSQSVDELINRKWTFSNAIGYVTSNFIGQLHLQVRVDFTFFPCWKLCKNIDLMLFKLNKIFDVYSETCINRPPLWPCFTAGIDSGPVYTVSIIWLPYKWFFSREPNIAIFFQIGGIFFSGTYFFAILSFNQNKILADWLLY